MAYERYSESLSDPFLAHEHAHRYWWSSSFVKGKHVLDIACGVGYGTAILAKEAEFVLGVDLSEEAIAEARTRYFRPNSAFQVGDCRTFETKELFDVCVSFETFEHLDKDGQQEFLKRVKAALKPNGTLIISTPNIAEYSENSGMQNEFHLHEVSIAEFKATLSEYFGSVEFFGQRMMPVSFITPIQNERIHFESALEVRGVSHAAGIAESSPITNFLPVYTLAVCGKRAVDRSAVKTSVLTDTSYRLTILDSAEAQMAGLDQEGLMKFLALTSERLTALENGVVRGTSDAPTTHQLKLLAEELNRQIDRISTLEQLSHRTAALETEMMKQIGRINKVVGKNG